MFLSFQMTFILVTAAVVWAILESTSGLGPSSDTIAPRYLKLWMVDCAGRLVVEAFYGSDQVVIDVIQPHGCTQSCMPNSVERLLEVHKDMVRLWWCCRYFSQSILRLKICSVVPLPALKPACSSLMISSACDFSLFRRILSMTLLSIAVGCLSLGER